MSRKQFLPSVNSSGDESISEDSEYIPTDNEANAESDEISDSSKESKSSDASEEEDSRKKIIGKKQNAIQKTLSKHEVQNSPRQKTKNGHKTVIYKDYVS